MRPRPGHRGRGSEPGFALLFVLWFLVLLSAVAIHLTASGRIEIALARNILAAAKAEALADAALVRAAFSLGDTRPQSGWQADGTTHTVAMPDGVAEVAAEDENGRINPNLASRDLLARLFMALGAGGDTAGAVSDAILRRRSGPAAPSAGTPGPPSPSAAAPPVTPTAASGEPGQAIPPTQVADQPPPGGVSAFESVDDLALLPEMPAELLAAARPYLTVYTRSAAPDPTHASELVRRVLAAASPSAGPGQTPPPAAAPAIVRLTIRARTVSGARFGREAVIRIDPSLPKGYGVLWWRRFDSAPPS